MTSPRPSLGWARLAISLCAAALIAGCGFAPTAPATITPAVACQPDDTDLPAAYPELRQVASIERAAEGVVVLVAAVPGDDSLTYVGACRYERHGTDILATHSGISVVNTALDGAISLDSRLTIETGVISEAMVAGRAAPEVSRVAVVAGDGSEISASILDGVYLAWWRGPLEGATVTAFGADGTELGAVTVD